MLGMQLVTHQTGPEGQKVRRLYIEEGADIAQELYLSVVLDRATGRVTFMASTEGGMDIEEVAEKHPEKIIKVAVDPATGIQGFHARDVAYGLGLKDEAFKAGTKLMMADLQGIHRARRLADRDQSAGRHEEERADRPRCQDEFRR